MRRVFSVFGAIGILFGICTEPYAEDAYPNRAIRIIVTSAAGGPGDVTARIVSKGMEAELGQSVIVENRTGANGMIGAAYVAKSAPDGYTLLFGSGSTQVVAPAMYKYVPYDPVRDFIPISLLGRATFVLLAGPTVRGNTIDEILDEARARPEEITFGTAAATYELAALILQSIGNVKLTRIPYKGFAPMILDLASGRIHLTVGPADGTTVNNPNIRTIAVLGSRRIPSRPDVATTAEMGHRELSVPAWGALFAPAGTPRPIVNRLMSAARHAVSTPEAQAQISAVGLDAEGSDDVELQRTMIEELVQAQDVMKKANLGPK